MLFGWGKKKTKAKSTRNLVAEQKKWLRGTKRKIATEHRKDLREGFRGLSNEHKRVVRKRRLLHPVRTRQVNRVVRDFKLNNLF